MFPDFILALSIGTLSLLLIYKLIQSLMIQKGGNRDKIFYLILLLVVIEIILIASYDLVFGYDFSEYTTFIYIVFFSVFFTNIVFIFEIFKTWIQILVSILKLLAIILITRFGLFSFIEYFGMIPFESSTNYCKDLPDGIYIGKSKTLLSNTVLLAEFRNKKIVNIEIIKGVHSSYGKKAFELLSKVRDIIISQFYSYINKIILIRDNELEYCL